MIKSFTALADEYKNYANPASKIKRLCDKGELTPIIKGLYETDNRTPGYCLASAIYGPSYLSFEYALAYHALIPEAVYTFTCATYQKRKAKQYTTPFGTFTYRDVPSEVYPYNVTLKSENGYSIFIATPEKALCDLLYTVSPCKNLSELKTLLFDDLRIDADEFRNLNMSDLRGLAALYRTKNHELLLSYLRRQSHE